MRCAVIVIAVLLGLIASEALAQQPEQIRAEQRLRELQGQIALFEERLSEARSEESVAVADLTSLDREISVREALIETYATRLRELDSEAITIENELEQAERELRRLRDEYARYARTAYMRGRIGDLALILSAGSINQMLVRARYLQRLTDHRQRAARRIIETADLLASRRAELDSTMAEVQQILADNQVEQAQLANRQREREQLVTQLQRQRSRLESEVGQRRDEAQRLNQRIQEFIAEAEAERRRAAEEERRREEEAARRAELAARAAEEPAVGRPADAAPPARAPAPPSAVSEAEFTRLSGSFRQNRGRLPWPVPGVVTEGFGPRRNPVLGTTITNPGVIISTTPSAPVRAVFTGAVARVWVMAGYGTCILLTHGDFSTVYCNLSGVDVQQGARVEAGTVVGRSGTDDQPLGRATLFGVFDGGHAVDPATWLSRR